MPLVPDQPAADAHVRPPLSTKGLKPADINADEMDEITMRIFRELIRQIEALESTEKKNINEASVRERDARILASLERTMERLAQIEAGRAAARKSKAMTNDGHGGRKALETRIDRIIAIEFEKATHSKAKQS
jgi:hypothetical protein